MKVSTLSVSLYLLLIVQVQGGEVAIEATGPRVVGGVPQGGGLFGTFSFLAIWDDSVAPIEMTGSSARFQNALVSLDAIIGRSQFTFNPGLHRSETIQSTASTGDAGPGNTQLSTTVYYENDPLFRVNLGTDGTSGVFGNGSDIFVSDLLFDDVGELFSGIADDLPVSTDNFVDGGQGNQYYSPTQHGAEWFGLQDQFAFTTISITRVPEPTGLLLTGAFFLMIGRR